MITKPTIDMVEGLTAALSGKAPTGDYATNSGVTAAIASAIAPLTSVLGTALATSSGTTKDFTGIPAWAKKITVFIAGFSHASGSNASPIIQLGSSAGFETTSYVSVGAVVLNSSTTGTGAVTSGFQLATALTAATLVDSSIMTIVRVGATNLWQYSCAGCSSASAAVYTSAGYKLVTGGALDRLRITTVEAATFDAGTINIMYE